MENISVVIPLGPDPKYKMYLPDCVESVVKQTKQPHEIVFVDDGMHISIPDLYHLFKECGCGSDFYNQGYYNQTHLTLRNNDKVDFSEPHSSTWNMGGVFRTSFGGCKEGLIGVDERIKIRYYRTWWNVGVADAFNFGIAIAQNNLVFMIGSDDIMMPNCLEECEKAYEEHNKEGWYSVTYQTDTNSICDIPNNSAMVTKKLWEELGGFPPSAGVAACDALLLSIMMRHMPDRIIKVKEGIPLCWLREGDYQDTRKNMMYYALSGVVEEIRNLETLRWNPKNE